MSRFQDLFIVQILGELSGRQYIGMVNFLFDDDKNPTSVWIGPQGISHVKYQNASGVESFYTVFPRTKGKLGLYPKVPVPDVPAIKIQEAMEYAVMNLLPPMPLSCAIMESSYLRRDARRVGQHSKFAEVSNALLQKIPSGGLDLARVTATTTPELFWETLVYLCGNGQVLCSYEQTLGRLLKKFQEQLLARLIGIFGTRALVPFTTSVREILIEAWPDWETDVSPDTIYGSAPYYLWAKTLKTNVATVGSPTLANRCFAQTLEKLPTTEAALLRHLCES